MVDDVLDQFARLAEQQSASGLVLFGYSTEAESTRLLLRSLIDGLEPCGLVDALYVDEHRWWSLMCTGRCCPVEGTPYELSSHPIAAEAVFAGLRAPAPVGPAVEDAVGGPAEAGRSTRARGCSASTEAPSALRRSPSRQAQRRRCGPQLVSGACDFVRHRTSSRTKPAARLLASLRRDSPRRGLGD